MQSYRNLDSRLSPAFSPVAGRARTLFGAVVLASLIVRLLDLDHLLEFNRASFFAGEFWRLFTGHLAHWSAQHMAWDFGAFVALSAMILARQSLRDRYPAVLGASVLAISILQLTSVTHLSAYRGLSGVDSALFLFLAADIVLDSWRRSQRATTLVALLCIVGFIGKIIAESSGGSALFATQMGPGVEIATFAHLVGAAVGMLAAVEK